MVFLDPGRPSTSTAVVLFAFCVASGRHRSPYGQQSVLFMKKSVGILSGLAIAIAVATTAGAWYTGKQLPAELDNALPAATPTSRRPWSAPAAA
jgi:hypothetical protein